MESHSYHAPSKIFPPKYRPEFRPSKLLTKFDSKELRFGWVDARPGVAIPDDALRISAQHSTFVEGVLDGSARTPLPEVSAEANGRRTHFALVRCNFLLQLPVMLDPLDSCMPFPAFEST
jgi:hypothetical protein